MEKGPQVAATEHRPIAGMIPTRVTELKGKRQMVDLRRRSYNPKEELIRGREQKALSSKVVSPFIATDISLGLFSQEITQH